MAGERELKLNRRTDRSHVRTVKDALDKGSSCPAPQGREESPLQPYGGLPAF